MLTRGANVIHNQHGNHPCNTIMKIDEDYTSEKKGFVLLHCAPTHCCKAYPVVAMKSLIFVFIFPIIAQVQRQSRLTTVPRPASQVILGTQSEQEAQRT